jgi:hypothetical protein
MLRHHAALVSGKLTRVTSGVNLPPLEVIMSRHLKGEEMDKLFWIIPGKLAGRPGPDREPWNLASLRQGGIGAVLSVNNGLLCHPEDFVASGITYACVPLSAHTPPQPGDDHICLRALPQAYAFVQAQMAGRVPLRCG